MAVRPTYPPLAPRGSSCLGSGEGRTRPGRGSDDPVVGRPAGQFVTVGELKLPQDGRDMSLHGLDRDGETLRGLLAAVPPSDETHGLSLPWRELVELGVVVHRYRPGEGIQHE